MKIYVLTMGTDGLDEFVGEHFGRASSFTIADMETNDVRVVSNTSGHFGDKFFYNNARSVIEF